MPLDLKRLLGIHPHPDGDAPAFEAHTIETDELAREAFDAPRPGQRPPPPRPDTVIQAALAQKILQGWMQNRYQTRYPLVLNFHNTTPDETQLLFAAIHQAVAAVDPSDAARGRARAWVSETGGTLPDTPVPIPDLIASLHAARIAPQAYAACAGSLGRRTATARRYLDFLAARLDLPSDVARSLNRRFAA